MIDNYKTKGLRNKMIRELEKLGITSPTVLKAMNQIPRHIYLDSAFMDHAYKNKAFPIGLGQTISHPYTVAFQSELLKIKKGDKVLEIGTGCGYQTAVLSYLGAQIYTIERIEELSKKAQKIGRQLGVKAHYLIGDGTLGWSSNAPYDKIIVTAGAPTQTPALIEQLKNGGQMVIPVGDQEEQKMHFVEKNTNGQVHSTVLGDFAFVPLLGDQGW